ncbi:RND transporter [Nitrospira sp. KM1]|uniref:efflux RND transporter periplasmic adaptor subunit n=1 Tax=Nitrospira sp. KM1 TaxID=1936990 RepID=UPI0013A72DFA|nr:efflux RND transporter periplasmic adaptor subunit [Nitrospira sp. KM1]BCA54512.1 RND transporter [Nitrospira sp. KM1]
MRRSTITLAFALSLSVSSCNERGAESTATPSHDSSRPTDRVGIFRQIQAPGAVLDRIKTEPASLQKVAQSMTAPGEIALDLKHVAKISSRIEGQVQIIHVQLGDRVRAGQPLLEIESLRLDELVQEYLVTKAQADVAASTYRRTENLWKERIVSERQLVEHRGVFLESTARHQHVREKLINMGMSSQELRELEHGSHQEGHKYIIKSPIQGTVIEQNVVRGQGVAPGNELFEIVNTDRVWVFANLPIEQARQFKEGDQATIIPKGGESVVAPLTYLSPVADEQTRTVKVRFEVSNLNERLKPHEFVEVKLAVKGSPTLAVPVSALASIDKSRGVFVQEGANYHFVVVDTGREGDGWIEISKGLTAGDQVVTQGVFDLKSVLLKEHIGSGE